MKRASKLDSEIPLDFGSHLEFFQRQVKSDGGVYSLVAASLLGALLGGFFTGLVGLLKR